MFQVVYFLLDLCLLLLLLFGEYLAAIYVYASDMFHEIMRACLWVKQYYSGVFDEMVFVRAE